MFQIGPRVVWSVGDQFSGFTSCDLLGYIIMSEISKRYWTGRSQSSSSVCNFYIQLENEDKGQHILLYIHLFL